MNLSEAKARREAIIARELDLHAEIAEAKRAWVVDKIEGDFGRRTEREAELANLAVEKHALNARLNGANAATKAYRNTLAHAILIKLVSDRGMAHLVIESDRLAVDAALAGIGATPS
jgi:hypothetical protein